MGNFTAPGLKDHSAHAVMCIDAIQFSDPPVAALRECRRILASAGRLAVTAREPRGYAAERTLWEAALQAGASGDPALVSLQEEATQALAAFDVRRRVLATATAPARSCIANTRSARQER